MPFNTPLPITGRDPDTVPFEERIRELEEARRNPAAAIRAARARRNREQAERDRQEFRERWLTAGGTEEEFERSWPDLRREMLKVRADELEAQARAASFEQLKKSF